MRYDFRAVVEDQVVQAVEVLAVKVLVVGSAKVHQSQVRRRLLVKITIIHQQATIRIHGNRVLAILLKHKPLQTHGNRILATLLKRIAQRISETHLHKTLDGKLEKIHM